MDRREMKEYCDKLKQEEEEFMNKTKSDEVTKNKTIKLLNTMQQLVKLLDDTRIPPSLFRDINNIIKIMLKYEKDEC
jgi:hypothetical protein